MGCLPLEIKNIFVFDLDLDNVIVEWKYNKKTLNQFFNLLY